MASELSPVDVLMRAAAMLRQLQCRPVVVKLGGSAMEDPVATHGAMQSVATLQALGVQLTLIHGGGKPIDRAMTAAGLTPVKVQGRRYTDEATLAVVVQVLKEVNAAAVSLLCDVGGECGIVTGQNDRGLDISQPFQEPERFPIVGRRLLLPGLDLQPLDLGRVGVPTSIDADRLLRSMANGFTPVLPSLARHEDDGGWLNVNADTAASAVAGALQAAACLFLTDTPGVLRDIKNPESLFARLTRSEYQQLIQDGIIAGGMIPKVEACFEALDAGAAKAVIIDGRVPHALLHWFLGEPEGTEIVP